MDRFLRLSGFSLSFAIVAMVLFAQLTARPTINLTLQVEAAQVRLDKPTRSRVGRIADLRRMPRPVAATLA